METKKTEKANLEPKKRRFFFIGLTIALASTLAAFEWGVPLKNNIDPGGDGNSISFFDDELPPITIPAPPEEIPLEQTKVEVSTIIEIVKDFVVEPTDGKDEPEWGDIHVNMGDIDAMDFSKPTPPAAPFIISEDMPEFTGGEKARLRYLQKNVNYPRMAIDENIQGTVYVQFIVNEDGSLEGIKVIRGIGGGCDKEALRVAKNMPAWKAGKQRGKKVRVQFVMPIKFTLKN